MLLDYYLPMTSVVVYSKSWSPAWTWPEPGDPHLPGSQGTHCDHILKVTIDNVAPEENNKYGANYTLGAIQASQSTFINEQLYSNCN
jgi:hypothetical protein